MRAGPARGGRDRARGPAARRPRPRCGRSRSTSHGRGIERELAAVEPRQVEEIADEAFEPARFGADHVRGPLARVGVGVVERAVGERFGVAADRRERRPEVVRDREQERALTSTRLLELGRHLVERGRRARRAPVGAGRDVGPARQVARRELPRGPLDLPDGPGEPPREPDGHDRGEEQHERSRRAARSGVALESTFVSTWSVAIITSCLAHDWAGRNGEEDGVAAAGRSRRCPARSCCGVEIGGVAASAGSENTGPSPRRCTVPSGATSTALRSVIFNPARRSPLSTRQPAPQRRGRPASGGAPRTRRAAGGRSCATGGSRARSPGAPAARGSTSWRTRDRARPRRRARSRRRAGP